MKGYYIKITNHCLQRFKERCKKRKRGKRIKMIVEDIKRSNLIDIQNGYEIRSVRGRNYVCARDESKKVLNIITVLHSGVKLRFIDKKIVN